MGNGKTHISVWGEESLCLSITCVGFGCEADDPIQIDGFGDENYPVCYAHLELRFADAARPVSGVLQSDGILRIEFSNARVITLECAMDEELVWLEGASDAQWELLAVQSNHYAAALAIEIDDGRGLIWEADESDSLVVIVRAREQTLFIATSHGEIEEAAKAAVSLARCKPDINPIYYWKQYWRMVPRIIWSDAQLQEIWNGVLFTQAQMNATANVPLDLTENYTNLLVNNRGDGIHILPATRPDSHAVSFDNIRVEGGFIIGASFEEGAVAEVRVNSERGGFLCLHPNAETRIERETAAGDDWIWRASTEPGAEATWLK